MGVLGFVEPCTIGGHLLFLDTQKGRSQYDKRSAVTRFILARTLVTGSGGALFAWLGQELVGLQTLLAVFFGAMYLAIGLYFLLGLAGLFNRQFNLSPNAWQRAQNPVLLGLAFGLNIPATAAPVLFVLLGLPLAASSLITGLITMAIFAFALSFPLIVFTLYPPLSNRMDALASGFQRARWFVGVLFAALGLWSIWFGLYIDPQFWENI
ncbi:MAG: hypothetical protein KUG74_14040 [Rhodobacteraceae bacterium]|nr:hypothetical protein [Paracoccaceae bacterium]